MKQIKHLLGMAAMLLFAASCSSDEPVDPVNPVVDKDQTRYLSVAISSPAGTRAYEDGSENESKIDNIVFCFYDREGKFLAKTTPITTGKQEQEATDKNNVERIWSKVVAVDLVQGQNLPAYVIAFVNPIDQSILNDLSRQQIENRTIYASLNRENSFPMSNSVYYGKDPFTGNTEKMMATPILNTQLFDTEQKAQDAIDDTEENEGVLTIYVERYAAKIGLALNTDNISNYTELKDVNGTTVTLKFTPKYWRPNAVSKTSYITKKFATSKTDDVAAYTDVDNRFKNTGMPEWNNETDRRSFWGCSPSYYENNYPQVSDDVLDVDVTNATETDYAVKYFSYKEIQDGIVGTETTPEFSKGSDKFNTTATYFYSRETTTSINAINNTESGNPEASIASVVIVGQYLVNDETTSHTFYIDHGNYYANDQEAMEALIARQNLLVINEGSDEQPKYKVATDPGYFNIEHPKKDVRGETPVAGRFVTLQLKSATVENLPKLHFYNGTGYTAVSDGNIDDVNRMLWRNVHTFEMYYNGLAFFNIPIQHLGYGLGTIPTNKPLMTNGKYNWKNIRLGDFGVVRNHLYTINVTSISGLATGLRSDKQPIVPPKDAVNYYVAAELNVLAWKVVSTQDVTL